MISFRCPSKDQIVRTFDSLEATDYSYPHVGATRGELPGGYNVDRHSAIIGHGDADFEFAKQAIRDWKPFDLPWITTFPQTAPAAGTMIAVVAHLFGMWWTNISRVIYTIDEADRFGFAYGTLPHHAESGEELFLVERSRETNEVHYRITAFSRPKHPLARLGYPFSRAAQSRFGIGSIEAMKRAISDPRGNSRSPAPASDETKGHVHGNRVGLAGCQGAPGRAHAEHETTRRRVMAEREQHEIQGRIVELPAVVRDASTGSVMYMVDRVAAQILIPDAFEAIEAAPGQTQVTLVIVDYRDNDLGDYDEVGIVFFVKPKGRPDAEVGSYIYKLPVNQSFTCEAGCRIWGFPKSVEEIDFAYASASATCRLAMNGQHVLTLTVPRGGDGETPEEQAVGYTLIDGVPHTNVFTRAGRGEQTRPGGDGVVLELGDHPIAEDLRSLGLPDTPPLLSAWSENMSGSFGASTKL